MGLLWSAIQAAGVIPIVHSSGGPLHDIVVPVDGQQTGMCQTALSQPVSSLVIYSDGLSTINYRISRKRSRELCSSRA